ncbi:MAG: saccharopine dehydrogenase NADP-binding domain-containing protein [Burkholderiales bacterium]|nr:saccharopine dehydrogenase NADP-binding domain-containing protein [Burkholderiales bacterium]
MADTWLLYGATGYTGNLIAREAARRGMRPVLAGRDVAKLQALGSELSLPHKVLPLDDPARLAEGLRGQRAVLHCAGPFSATSQPMRDACIAALANYLDITGEIDVFEAAFAQDAQARAAGVLLCPGVGFDVVPTDCVAAQLKARLPDANALRLGFSGVDHLSAGTLVTSMEAIDRGTSRVRRGGRIVDIPFGEGGRTADFGRGPEPTFLIPWGDVSTAFHTTGIPDIEVHIPRGSLSARAFRTIIPMRGLFAGPLARRMTHALMRTLGGGPSEKLREHEVTRIWGEACNPAGECVHAVLKTPNGYSLTIETALLAVRRVLDQEVPAGFRTPSQLLGADCLDAFGWRTEVH